MPNHILVGYDGSETARRAFLFAIELARCAGGRVRVVSVLQVDNGTDTAALLMTDNGNGKARREELQTELTALEPGAASLIEVDLIHGSPGDALLTQVTQHGIDHIVIGHTERGALARWLLGSTSHDVLAKAHVPVTVVR